jgi:hypothetical protein
MNSSEFSNSVEVLREVAEFTCQNLQRVLNEKTDHTKSFECDQLSEKPLISDSTFMKMKRLREEENDEWDYFNPHKLWGNGKE